MRLTFSNTLDKRVYTFDQIEDYNDTKLFYHFSIRLVEGMPDGSYEYNLYDDDDIKVATGNVQIGDYKQVNTAYTKNNEFIQYRG